MILMLSAEIGSNGLWDYENDVQLEYSDTPLSNGLINEIKQWVADYEPYTALPDLTNTEIANVVKKLDKKGIDILRKIRTEWNVPEKYYYYSVAKDNLKHVLYKDGSEKGM